MKAEIQNTPWECDDIIFLSGDWEISRAAEEGKYQYTVSGIASSDLASAADLVKWKMAKALPMELLQPWEDDGITFSGGVEILRDFLNASGKNKYYLLADGSAGTGLLRVNKYYLIKEKYATPSEEVKQEIARAKVKSKKYNRFCEPWPNDDIFLLDPPPDETITRASSPGYYRKFKDSMSVTWKAETLLSTGRALSGYDVRLEELASSESVSMQEYYNATQSFWYAASGRMPTLSEIAHIWCSLQYNPDGAIAGALLAELNQAIESFQAFHEKLAEFNDQANDLDDAIRMVQPKVLELENLFATCEYFHYRTIFDDFTAFPNAVEEFEMAKGEIESTYSQLSTAFAKLDGVLSAIKQEVSQMTQLRFFPHDVLPQECVRYLQAKEDAYSAALQELQDFSPYDLRLSDLRASVELIQSLMEPMDLSAIKANVDRTVARKAELDALKEVIVHDDKYHKKPGMFTKPRKEDGIKFTTGVQIKHQSAGTYVITYYLGSIAVSVPELIYLELAEQI